MEPWRTAQRGRNSGVRAARLDALRDEPGGRRRRRAGAPGRPARAAARAVTTGSTSSGRLRSRCRPCVRTSRSSWCRSSSWRPWRSCSWPASAAPRAVVPDLLAGLLVLGDCRLQRPQDVVVRARVRLHVSRQVLERVAVAVDRVGLVDPAVVAVVQQDLPARRRRGLGGRAGSVRGRSGCTCEQHQHGKGRGQAAAFRRDVTGLKRWGICGGYSAAGA